MHSVAMITHWRNCRAAGVAVLLASACNSDESYAVVVPSDESFIDGAPVELNDNGAWSWFMDERVIVHDGKLLVGSVRAIGDDDVGALYPDAGNVEVAVWDLETDEVEQRVLFHKFQQDDHNNPSFLPRTDGSVLAVYTRHKVDHNVFIQRSRPDDLLDWSEPTVFVTPRANSGSHQATYSNLYRLPSGRIANFYRGYDQDPNLMYSDDDGVTWTYGGRLLRGRDGYSPYMKYCQDRTGAIHFVATEDHPRQYDNSLYHGILDGDTIRLSDGTMLGDITYNTTPIANIVELTPVFQGDPDNVAWMTDIELDEQDRPVIAFSVQKDGRYSGTGQGGHDLRYRYARWDGARWRWHEMAYAGHRLYPNEDDYSGLATLDPQDPRVVYISTSADPVGGEPLVSASDGKVHYELYRGRTADDGETWDWQAITHDSKFDNLRPLVPRWDDERTALVWMRGKYVHTHGEWSTRVVGMILE